MERPLVILILNDQNRRPVMQGIVHNKQVLNERLEKCLIVLNCSYIFYSRLALIKLLLSSYLYKLSSPLYEWSCVCHKLDT